MVGERETPGKILILVTTAALLAIGIGAVTPGSADDDCTWTGRLGLHCGAWKAEFDNGATREVAYSVDINPDGETVYLAGSARENPAGLASDFLVVAYDVATGTEQWSTTLDGDGSSGGGDIGYDVTVGPGGDRVFVTGQVNDGAFGTFALDAATGDTLWSAIHDPVPGATDRAFDVAVDPDGATVYVTGQTVHFAPPWEIHVVAYDTVTGDERWVSVYDGPVGGRDLASGLVVSPDGERLYVTGESEGDGTGQDLLAIALDTITGALEWEFRYEGRGTEEFGISPGIPDTIGVSPDGETVFFAGSSMDSDLWWDFGYRTFALDAETGSLHWEASYDAGSVDGVLGFAVSPDGSRVFVTGGSEQETTTHVEGTPVMESSSLDALTVAYDAESGEELWTALYQDPTHGGARFNGDKMNDLVVSPDGSVVYATGQSHSRSEAPTGVSSDAVTFAYDAATGEELWGAAYNGPLGISNGAWGITITPDGKRVIAAGWTDGTVNDRNLLALAYDAQGTQELLP